MMINGFRMERLATLALISLSLPMAFADTSSTEILEGFGMTPDEIQRLERGEILTYSDEAYEFTKRQLSADAMIHVDSSIDAIMKALQDDPTLIPNDLTLENGVIQSEADFDGVAFGPDDIKEVEDLLTAKPGNDYNFSADEYAMLRKMLQPHRSSPAAKKLEAASDAMRAVLIGRYKEYRAKGLAGVAPYQRSGRKKVDVAAELQLTTDTIEPFENDFPEFVKVMMTYPEGAACCQHVYRWVKVRIRKRPGYALSHTIIQATGEFALVTERVFYVSNQLNSLQITTVWLPYEGGGNFGLAMTASADILDSTLGRMLRRVGRNKAKDIVAGVMEETKADLEGLAAAD